MARISVDELLVDPDFTDIFTVIRRKQVINDFGEPALDTKIIPNLIGVITHSDNNLDRPANYQVTPYSISLISNFPLRGQSRERGGQSFHPDIVLWRGNHFVVKQIDPYPQFGPGFFQTICESVEFADQASLPDNYYPQLIFSQPENAVYYPIVVGALKCF